MKYASSPKSITTDKTKRALAADNRCLPIDWYIPLAMSQSDRVTNANISRKSPLVL